MVEDDTNSDSDDDAEEDDLQDIIRPQQATIEGLMTVLEARTTLQPPQPPPQQPDQTKKESRLSLSMELRA